MLDQSPSKSAFLLRRPSLRVVALLSLSALLMGGCLFGLLAGRSLELRDEQENLQRIAVSLAEQTSLAFREIDLVLRETRPGLSAQLMDRRGKDLHELLRNHFLGVRQGQALLAFGPDGQLRGHSRVWPTSDINGADRGYFRAQVPAGDRLHISAPLRNRVNGRWMIGLSRRLTAQNGDFAGVLMAAVDMEYFLGLYEALQLPSEARLLLTRSDGAKLVVYPFDESRLNDSAAPEDNGSLLSVAAEVPGLPVSLRLSLPRDAVLNSWRWLSAATLAGLLAVVTGIAGVLAMRRSHLGELRRRNELLEQSERALRESETRFRTIVETANEGVFILDGERRINYVNPQMAQMLGYRESDLMGSMVDELLAEPRPDPSEPEERKRRTEASRFERRYLSRKGTEVWASVSSTPLYDKDGVQTGSFAMVTDITAHKQEELMRAGVEGILRHDLRSPLAAMAVIPDMLLADAAVGEQQRWLAEELRRYVRRMLRMVDAYLRLASIERADFRLEASAVDLIAVLREVEAELAPLLRNRQARLTFSRNGAAVAEGDSLVIQAEATLCQTMLTNLLKNALEASPREADVSVEVRETPGRVEIAIENQGEVPLDIRARFFQKYATSGKLQGTGLGAYSARLIARAHGGDAALRADVPGRTTITVTLPRAEG